MDEKILRGMTSEMSPPFSPFLSSQPLILLNFIWNCMSLLPLQLFQVNDSDTLISLKQLLEEFYGIGTSNVRKREIETLLSDFGRQRHAWKQCFYFMSHSDNQYIWMFCLTNVIEVIIHHH